MTYKVSCNRYVIWMLLPCVSNSRRPTPSHRLITEPTLPNQTRRVRRSRTGRVMILYHCRLTFHDNLYYETRTLGRLYETGRLLHNIALCYALGFAQTTFFHEDNMPKYAQELAALSDSNIYVTPAG